LDVRGKTFKKIMINFLLEKELLFKYKEILVFVFVWLDFDIIRSIENTLKSIYCHI